MEFVFMLTRKKYADSFQLSTLNAVKLCDFCLKLENPISFNNSQQ